VSFYLEKIMLNDALFQVYDTDECNANCVMTEVGELSSEKKF